MRGERLPWSVEYHEWNVSDAGLIFRGSGFFADLTRAVGVRLMRTGLMLIDARRTSLSWAEHRDAVTQREVGWWIGYSQEPSPQPIIAFRDRPRPRYDTNWVPWDREIALATNVTTAARSLEWLCVYLARTSEARAGVEVRERAVRLVEGLTRMHAARRFYGLGEPLMGPKLDVFLTIERVLHQELRYLGGRLVTGDPPPQIPKLAALVAAKLPHHLHAKWRRVEFLQMEVEKHINAVAPWPFGELLETPLTR